MTEIKYTLTLLSDAEPGTGMGGELVNERVPKDANGNPVIPANHLKGLLREELLRIEKIELDSQKLFNGLADCCFGKPDDNDSLELVQYNEGLCRFSDATMVDNEKDKTGGEKGETDYITRTAMDLDTGRAERSSLRTTERIAVGTPFQGTVFLPGDGTSKQELAIRMALLSLAAIGGGRNRGRGKVIVTIDNGDKRTPGALLRAMKEAPDWERLSSTNSDNLVPGTQLTALRLTFMAEGPVCLPERPVVVGPIQTGFAISASTVRGWIINRLAGEYGDDLASTMYENEKFRAWPLLPCGFPGQKEYPIPVRVSLTHKIAKLVTDGDKLKPNKVEDKPIEEVDVDKIENNSPLKASDGVLLVDLKHKEQDQPSISLWKARSMPHIMTAHGVLNDRETKDGRNLYQVESMAPLVWSGVVLLPENWANLLMTSVEKNPAVAFGRFRTTRGFGQLKIEKYDNTTDGLPWSQTRHDNIIILQTPILLPDKPSESKTANQELEQFIKTEWKELFADGQWEVETVSTNIGIRFGWNRNSKGEMTGKGCRQKACRVVLPGTIFRILAKEQLRSSKENKLTAEKREILHRLIQRGLGPGIDRGYGAVSVHPGTADKVFQKSDENQTKNTSRSQEAEMAEEMLALWRNHRDEMPSPSQIAAVAGIAAKDVGKAQKYLDEQLEGRTERIWATWKEIKQEIDNLFNKYKESPKILQFGLKLLGDLVKANDTKNNGGNQ